VVENTSEALVKSQCLIADRCVASFPHTAGSVDELMRSADRAMAQSRERGGNYLTLASIQFAHTESA